MLGLLVTGIKQQLGPMINGYISNEFYIPAPSLQFTGTRELMEAYQKRAAGARRRSARLHLSALCLCGGADPRQGRDRDQVARTTTSSRNISAANTFDTVIGPISFGPDGEWTKPRIICIQFQGVTGSDIAQFKDCAAGRGLSAGATRPAS